MNKKYNKVTLKKRNNKSKKRGGSLTIKEKNNIKNSVNEMKKKLGIVVEDIDQIFEKSEKVVTSIEETIKDLTSITIKDLTSVSDYKSLIQIMKGIQLKNILDFHTYYKNELNNLRDNKIKGIISYFNNQVISHLDFKYNTLDAFKKDSFVKEIEQIKVDVKSISSILNCLQTNMEVIVKEIDSIKDVSKHDVDIFFDARLEELSEIENKFKNYYKFVNELPDEMKFRSEYKLEMFLGLYEHFKNNELKLDLKPKNEFEIKLIEYYKPRSDYSKNTIDFKICRKDKQNTNLKNIDEAKERITDAKKNINDLNLVRDAEKKLETIREDLLYLKLDIIKQYNLSKQKYEEKLSKQKIGFSKFFSVKPSYT